MSRKPWNISKRTARRLHDIALRAREDPTHVFDDLAEAVDLPLLRDAWRLTTKRGAPGSDGVSPREFGKRPEERIRSILAKFSTGDYIPSPLRRVEVPKRPGEKRILGIPSVDDRVLQRAVAMLLGVIYETEFRSCSFAYRPGRSPQRALGALTQQLHESGGGWVLDLDIAKFFDTIDRDRLECFLDRRIRDARIRALIRAFIDPGIQTEGGIVHEPRGIPQGTVISPLLANLFLNEVLDTWFLDAVTKRLHSEAHLFRYGDDVVILFGDELSARSQLVMLPKRLATYGLRVNEDKTNLVCFLRPDRGEGRRRFRPARFDFLGFTHYWTKSARGRWVVRRKMAHERFERMLGMTREWCKETRDRPVWWQYHALRKKVRGYHEYYRLSGNIAALDYMSCRIERIWRTEHLRDKPARSSRRLRAIRYMARHTLPRPRPSAGDGDGGGKSG